MKSGPRRGYARAGTSKIANKPTCGGNKKTGLTPTVGKANILMLSSLNRATNTNIWAGLTCQQAKAGYNDIRPMPLTKNPTCSGGVGRHPSATPHCGIWTW